MLRKSAKRAATESPTGSSAVDDLNVRPAVAKTIREKPYQVRQDTLPHHKVEPGELAARTWPICKLKIGGQRAVVIFPLTENKPMMPYLG